MTVQVQFYAQLRDIAGTSQSTVELPQNATIGDLLQELYRQKPALRSHDNAILAGAGLEFVNRDYVLQGGEMVSIMPPVQGG